MASGNLPPPASIASNVEDGPQNCLEDDSPGNGATNDYALVKSDGNGEKSFESSELPAPETESLSSLEENKAILFNSLEKLFKLTASGYAKKGDSNGFLESIFSALADMRSTFMKLDKPNQIKCAEQIGDRPEFMAVLIPFMSQVYRG